jgi:hypothetical protein
MLAGACDQGNDSRAAGGQGRADSTTQAAATPVRLRVSNVMIGRRLGAGNRITDPTFQFAPTDTVYVSVATEGTSGAGTVTAAWRSQNGEILQQSSQPVGPADRNAELHLSQDKGLKPGTYKVVLFLGGDSVDTQVFVVRR